MFQGKKKAITFSYDDGVTQDVRLIEIFNRYGLKATFNLNSGLLGHDNTLKVRGVEVKHNKVEAQKVKEIYRGHEVAVHTLTHPNLTQVSEQEVIRQVECDRENLEKLVGYEVCGMAYPMGGINNNDEVARILKQHTKVRYSRTITSSYNFELQENLLRFNPTISHLDENLFPLVKEFLALKPDNPKILYIWGHSYELDVEDGWTRMENLCKLLSGREDIFYGTNREVLL